MDRRGFLRFLGIGAAAAVAAPIIKPKSFFSFFTGEVWKPSAVRHSSGSMYFVNWDPTKVYKLYLAGAPGRFYVCNPVGGWTKVTTST